MNARLVLVMMVAGSFALGGPSLLVPIDKCTGRWISSGVAPVDPCPQGESDTGRPKPPMVHPEVA